MSDVFERVTAGLLMERITKSCGCDMTELDGVVDGVARELSHLCIMQSRKFPVRDMKELRLMVVQRLNDLLRRGMLYFDWGGARHPWLVLHAREGTKKAIAEMLAPIRS